jgi:hypothetical protein
MSTIARFRLMRLLILLLLAASACNLPSRTPGDEEAASTAAAQTLEAEMTQSVPSIPTATFSFPATSTFVIPTLVPTSTPVLATSTSSCDIAQFVTDVTIPDGTNIPAGQAFTKTWRFKNAGSCSWTPAYSVVFSSGDQMGGPNTQALTGNVNPGQSVDISVNLTAPSSTGEYKGFWKLRNSSGVLFNTFYVQINVQAPVTLTPTTAQVMLNAIPAESGTVYEGASGLAPTGTITAGDTAANFIGRGFMSFDIGSLSGKTISSATLDLTSCSKTQDPFTGSLAGIWVGELQYALPLDQTDYDISGTAVVSQALSSIPTSLIDVKSFVQSRVNEGKARFQIRLHPKGPSDADGQVDSISCSAGAVVLKISYQP